jgi:hypothetical protein
MSAAEDYLLLGLRLGRHVEGLVDAYYGPAELKKQVDAESLVELERLVADGDALLAQLEDGWLHDQAAGLRTYAGVLAGEELSYSDEVERCYGVRPARVSTDVYAAVHDELDELLPGSGDLAERYEAWRDEHTVPPEKVVPVIKDLLAELRACTAAVVDLPAGEEVVVKEVSDEPWWAFNYYQGDLHSRVVVNLDVNTTSEDIVELTAHEVYPGHHTEHSLKEELLFRRQGKLEESIFMVPTPSALVSEGLAETGPGVVLDEDAWDRLAGVFDSHGLESDLDRARAVRAARRPLRRIGVDAALMIHEDGASVEEAQAYAERWSLRSGDEVAHSLRFVTSPTWRAYVINYSAGYDVCSAWVGGDLARFRRLLTEHVRVSDLVAAISSS